MRSHLCLTPITPEDMQVNDEIVVEFPNKDRFLGKVVEVKVNFFPHLGSVVWVRNLFSENHGFNTCVIPHDKPTFYKVD
jgi:hypothetical protein